MSELINPLVKEVKSYKCNWCGHLYTTERDADMCALKHAKTNLANTMLNDGFTLESIEYWCNFRWSLSDEQKNITKDNCFIVSHWQCCDKPAYKIVAIEDGGYLKLWGKGSWSGYYGNAVSLDRLPKPYPPEDLFVDKR